MIDVNNTQMINKTFPKRVLGGKANILGNNEFTNQ